MTKKIIKLCLGLIVVLAFGLRFHNVTADPPSLNWDEVAIGYNAYSILKTGHDEWNQLLPVHFKSYGEYKLPAQIYASIPAIAIFGLNDFGVRITPVIYGTLTVLLIFLLARTLFNSVAVGLVSALFLAISPWHIQLTRASFESSFSVFWVVFGIWLLAKGFQNSKWLIWSMVPFAISTFTYNSARVFTPLFLVAVLICYREKLIKFKKSLAISVVVFAVLMLPLIPFLVTTHGTSRYKLVSVTDDPGLVQRINQARGHSSLNQPLPELLYNKITFVGLTVVEHYLSHFSPNFLFISGAPHKQHHVQSMGELYLYQAPLLLLGLWFLLKKPQPFRGLLIIWLLLAFVPVSLTNDSIPHALRTLIAAPFYAIITAFGLVTLFGWLKTQDKRFFVGLASVFSVVLFLSLLSYLQNFYSVYPYKYSRDWQYGYEQVIDYITAHSNDYDQIIFTNYYGQAYMFNLFYLQYNPQDFQNDPNLVRIEPPNNFVDVQSFGKFKFVDLSLTGHRYQDLIDSSKRQLFVGKPGDLPADLPRLLTIKFLDDQIAFEVASP